MLSELLAGGKFWIGQVLVEGGVELRHAEDEGKEGLKLFGDPEDAAEIVRWDDAGAYRPLKTAPNLRHGWRLKVADVAGLRLALELIYPGRAGAFLAWREGRLAATPLRETLGRQTGMYRITQKISDAQADALVGGFAGRKGAVCARFFGGGMTAESCRAARCRRRNSSLPPGEDDSLALPGSLQFARGRSAGSRQRRATRVIYRSRMLVTMDGPPIEDGAILVRGEFIAAAGPWADVRREYSAEQWLTWAR